MKNLLLKNKWIWTLNKNIKARQVEMKYKSLVNEYSKKETPKTVNDLMIQNGWREFNNNQPKIFYLGTDPLQDLGGFNQSLAKLFDTKFFYKEDGSYGQYFGDQAREKNVNQLGQLLNEYCKNYNWIPDVLLMQSFGFNLDINQLENLKTRFGFKIINIGMDERLAYKLGIENGYEKGIYGLNAIIDLALVTTPECVDWYVKEGIPALYYPLASNDEIYYPINEKEKKYDVGFIGRKYGLRSEIVEYLISNGVNVQAFGPGWENGVLDVKENNAFYNSCKIVLGTGNIGYSSKLMNPKLRDFEVPFSKTMYITNYTHELSELFEEDQEIVFYEDKEDLLKKIRYYLENEVERERIAQCGYMKAISKHSYDVRLSSVFNSLYEM